MTRFPTLSRANAILFVLLALLFVGWLAVVRHDARICQQEGGRYDVLNMYCDYGVYAP